MMNNEQNPQLTIPRVTSSVFCSDNLELMKTIESNTIDLIYCDILYGTGRNFGDYQDLKPIRSEIENHYLPRIKEMHRILKDTGSIYLQMDTKINHWMRCIMDDIFGYENFRNEISWRYKRWTMTSKNKWQNMHDVILMYGVDNEVKATKSVKSRTSNIKDVFSEINFNIDDFIINFVSIAADFYASRVWKNTDFSQSEISIFELTYTDVNWNFKIFG